MPAVERGAVPFVEAIAYLKDRLAIADSDWRALLRAAGARAETVVDAQAEAMHKDLLAAAGEIYAEGGTPDDFKARYQAIADRYGWATPSDPGWHSNLIWRMETFGARAAGRWEQARRLQAANPRLRYYFRYVTAGDHRVRDTHRKWHDVILPIDHWFWRTHFPPNGFNCRCHVMIVSERDLVRYGWTVTADDDPRLAIPPDDGFEGNVGMAWDTLRGGEPLPAAQTRPPDTAAEQVDLLVRDAMRLAGGYSVPVAQPPRALAAALGARPGEAIVLSADTVRRHFKHREATARAYRSVTQALLDYATVVMDPVRSYHFRLIGLVEGKFWAAYIKREADGSLRLLGLHRINRGQAKRRIGSGRVVRQGQGWE